MCQCRLRRRDCCAGNRHRSVRHRRRCRCRGGLIQLMVLTGRAMAFRSKHTDAIFYTAQPKPFIRRGIRPREHPYAFLSSVSPLSIVSVASAPFKRPFAMEHSLLPLSVKFISSTIHISARTIWFTVPPQPFVSISIWVPLGAYAVF